VDKDGKLLEGKVNIRITCGDLNTFRHRGKGTEGVYSLYLNNVEPSCRCSVSAESEVDGFYAEHEFFIREEYHDKTYNYDIVFKKTFNSKKNIDEYIARIKKENSELRARIDALGRQVVASKEIERQLHSDINRLSRENENLQEHLNDAERAKKRIIENTLPAEEYFGLYTKLTEEYSETKASLEQKLRALEKTYKRALAVNTFKAECKCIGMADNSIKLSLRLETNEVNDETDGLFIAGGQPLYQRVKVRIRVKALKDENAPEGFVTIFTNAGSEYLEIEHFFDEKPIEVVFRSSDKAFRDGFLQNKPGRMIEILTLAGMTSESVYLPRLAEDCKHSRPLPPLDVPVRP
jgi:hypothetical protein